MATTVQRHPLDDPDPDILWESNQMGLTVLLDDAATQSACLKGAFDYAWSLACTASVLESPPDDWLEPLQAARAVGLARLNKRLDPPGRACTLEIRGTPHTFGAGEVPFDAYDMTRLRAVLGALADADGLQQVQRMPIDRLSQFSQRSWRVCHIWTLQHLDAGDQWQDFVALGRSSLQTSDDVFMAALGAPLFDALEALARSQADRLDDALAALLSGHRELYGVEERNYNVDGMLCPEALDLAATAHRRGIEVSVRSEYMPHWLVLGGAG